jgi:hypothetical protein
VANVDVKQLVNTGDPAALAAGAQAFKSMATFNKTSNANPSCMGQQHAAAGSAAAIASSSEQEVLQSVIDAKSRAFVSSLATASSSLVSDPQSMKQVSNALQWMDSFRPCIIIVVIIVIIVIINRPSIGRGWEMRVEA